MERVAKIWRDAGFKVKTYDNIDQLVWEKLICNVCYSGPCTVLECTIGEVIDDESAWAVASRCALEAFDVARAHGIPLEIEDAVQYVREFGLKIPRTRPSVLLDHMARRVSEIGVINGAIPLAARAVGLEAPYNEVITALVKAKEARF